jgi:hypothetical protein
LTTLPGAQPAGTAARKAADETAAAQKLVDAYFKRRMLDRIKGLKPDDLLASTMANMRNNMSATEAYQRAIRDAEKNANMNQLYGGEKR